MTRRIFKKEILLICLILFVGLEISINTFFLKVVRIDERFFWAELALDQDEQKKGLGNRESLCQSCAMLFDFKKNDERGFWMKDMRFDLDIIWLSEGKIVYIEKNFSHKSNKTVKPHLKADKVLEIRAGFSDEYGFAVGDKVKIYY